MRGNKWKVDFRFLAWAPEWMLFLFIKIVNKRRTNMAAEVFVHCFVEFEIMTTDDK